ncbi:exodeoxyribonuclease 7 large subunit [Lachnospiraceae bacterium]|uniref:exodeoxyribonuclease VII large subunit n=1 Tax=Extibacter sp. GGCC_0201 TaxID=2731209 RepID=UPI001AA12591|nr:exodeoxyribonuclease VII large subunit [Extibacter sp. GGCC_0201]MBO1719241.1 exodeoxyribonuclease VII large subunit [Extibacter sp. GGCC_0201]BDF34100.1 exodeoxyribonuclease 7 large subunit [Lachnospiraceae bacterium]BDF38104.1 exodeoxyribonuclease 7 large subunit [Lachnospiraceae bacterium]
MQNVYTVKQVNAYIKNMFTQDYMLGRIYVKGEVSNCKYHTSGHIYFSLKDESGTIACVMFAGQRGGLSFRMGEGQQVIVMGAVNVYERSGSYQLYAKEIRLDGEGVLYEKFQMLKRELEEMGMFALEYKKPIPAYAQRIGVVTAPTGAAVRDIMNIARRRNPYVQLILYPARVQGEGAKESIVRGIRMLQQAEVDVMIVGRGGGSIEDLWAFNEEEVARAIFDCTVPVISAVGHETDTTIADYVADLRAPTPSAAAELAVYDYGKLSGELAEAKVRLSRLMRQKIQLERLRMREYQTKLKYLHPEHKLRDLRQRLSDMEDRLRGGMEGKLMDARHKLAVYVEMMKGLSPVGKLNQGYSYVQGASGRAVKSIRDVEEEDRLSVYVTDGIVYAVVEGMKEEEHG